MAKHTAGPWKIGEVRHGWDCIIRSAANDPVAGVVVAGYTPAEARANARLIAAAPLMRAALEEAAGGIEEWVAARTDSIEGLTEIAAMIRDTLRHAGVAE